ncbi:MAG: LLM class flavin-dependent oxidoreductase [Halobacteriota archaeon]|nr:LLM class flavin-dependent oxidoreductase [Halobacteriota archaeon]
MIKFGFITRLYPYSDVQRSAILGEKLGFDSIWMGDHIMGMRSPHSLEAWSTLAAIAAQTEKIKLGVGVTDPHRRHPAVTAQAAITLDIISKGRAILGMGAGEAMNLNSYGIDWSKPVSRMEEATEVIKKLWTEKTVNYSGEFYNLKDAILMPKPVQKPHPPLWIAGNSPRTIRMTGELGDGWFPTALSPDLYREDLSEVKKYKNKEDDGEIEAGYLLYTSISEESRKAWGIAEVQARGILLAMGNRLERLGYRGLKGDFDITESTLTDLSAESARDALNVIKQISKETIKSCFAIGAPDDCIAAIERWIDVGVRYFVIILLDPVVKIDKVLKLYGEKVIPYFKEID